MTARTPLRLLLGNIAMSINVLLQLARLRDDQPLRGLQLRPADG